jgi:hypothetical protein
VGETGVSPAARATVRTRHGERPRGTWHARTDRVTVSPGIWACGRRTKITAQPSAFGTAVLETLIG